MLWLRQMSSHTKSKNWHFVLNKGTKSYSLSVRVTWIAGILPLVTKVLRDKPVTHGGFGIWVPLLVR